MLPSPRFPPPPAAVAILIAVEEHVDPDRVLAVADGFLDEIDDEDDGLMGRFGGDREPAAHSRAVR